MADCSGDYLAFHDGLDSSSPLIEKSCGSSVPVRIRSTQRHMHVVFHLDEDATDNVLGFAASYYSGNTDIYCIDLY